MKNGFNLKKPMKYPTTVKKYRITDYSQLSNSELAEQLQYYMSKIEEMNKKLMDINYAKVQFSIYINLHNLTDEIFKRIPEHKREQLNFELMMEDLAQNPNKNYN